MVSVPGETGWVKQVRSYFLSSSSRSELTLLTLQNLDQTSPESASTPLVPFTPPG